jgi:polyketide biosynthesis enoyl-CoA hydratase PksH
MEYETLHISVDSGIINATINRQKQRNSISSLLINELAQILDEAERRPEVKMLVISGSGGLFCTGMDFEEVVVNETISKANFSEFMALLKRFTLSSKIVVARVEGQVLAGGVGVAAACDLVLATHDSKFGLSELLWGLVPAMVMPFLVRRTGFQSAYRMALTTETLSAEEAKSLGLVDIVDSNLDETLRRISGRLLRLNSSSVMHLKRYMRDMWLISEAMEELAVSESYRFSSDPQVRENINRFVTHRQFPWE